MASPWRSYSLQGGFGTASHRSQAPFPVPCSGRDDAQVFGVSRSTADMLQPEIRRVMRSRLCLRPALAC